MKTYEKKIEKIFERGRQEGLVTNRNKTYQEAVNRMAKWFEENYGPKKANPNHWRGWMVDAYVDHLVDRYEKGDFAGSSIQKVVHSIEKARVIVKETKCLGKKDGKPVTIRTGLKDERLEMLLEKGVTRSKNDISARKSTMPQADLVRSHLNDNLQFACETGKNTNVTRNAENISNVVHFQQLLGSRITAAMKLKVEDIDFQKGFLTFHKDKNNFTRRVKLSEEAKTFLKGVIDGKSPGALVFEFRKKNGDTMSPKGASSLVQEQVKNAAMAAGLYTKESRYTTHSFRKAYAQNIYDSTRNMSKSQIRDLIAEHLAAQGSNKLQIKRRLKNEMKRINKNNTFKNNFSHEQYRRLYCSLCLGHSRIDVVARHYITPDKPKRISKAA
ncbi:site-specific integrase [Bacillus cereus group sp. Bc061]|uniref:site-specific integrase n=1 Tax=Bacillus cereus group sp. Bc061 TaxID=3018117 RepID=UPI0022E86C95|nr:site-specific integrase [Bacillus cereus group sp. Bc061]MDA2599437.1 site-specific integrase [Bacillus cereus group sp. Bc061]